MEDVLKKVADAPAVALHQTIDTSKKVVSHINKDKTIKRAKKYWTTLGPGLTTGAADDDPSGIATYSQTGSQYGFQLIF